MPCHTNSNNPQIEFPSILLPPSISSGSIVDITVSRNLASEASSSKSFLALQSAIYSTYGQTSPSRPILHCRNATQTSVVLEWDPISLATAQLRSLALYRNGSKAGNIPRPFDLTSTKISGLAVDTAYAFHLVLRTSAGQYSSDKLTVRTHKMTDLSGITVTPGVLPGALRDSLSGAVQRIGAKIADSVRIDTTHFVCTEGRGRDWERALEMNIPVVRPEWIEGCEREGRIVGVRGYYLDANPKLRQVGQGVGVQQAAQQQSSPRTMPVRQQQEERRPASPTSAPPASTRRIPPEPEGADAEEQSTSPAPLPPAKDNAELASRHSEEVEDNAHAKSEGGREDTQRDLTMNTANTHSTTTGGNATPRLEVPGGEEDVGEEAPRSPEGSFSEVQL